MTDTALTVVIPVWGAYRSFLPTLIREVRRVAPGSHIMVVDNASRPPITGDEACHEKIVTLAERQTVGFARNSALELVASRLVAFLDADDLPLTPGFGTLWDLMRANPGLVGAAGRSVDSRTGALRPWPPRYALPLSRRRRGFATANSIRCIFAPAGAVMTTAEVVDAGGFDDSEAAEDWALSAALAYRGKIILIDNPAKWYRIHEGSLWHNEIGLRQFHRHRRRVRERLRRDRVAPAWVRRAPILLAAAQLTELYVRLVFVERLGRASERTRNRVSPPTMGKK